MKPLVHGQLSGADGARLVARPATDEAGGITEQVWLSQLRQLVDQVVEAQ
ncbi:MAG: hypothetical protein HOV70_06455 [Streptomyces sp.]|nr:hypothetical protein [Streptomyces sp.]NUS75829.1 hypothetical protein [Streptomyces sp.]